VWAQRLRATFRKQQLDREFTEELATHLEMHIADNLRDGMPREQARREALMKLGGVQQTKETHRDQRGIAWFETLLQDLRFGVRILRKNPGFTFVAVVALALGIGFSSIVFSIFYNGVLHPFPYRNADRLLSIYQARLGSDDLRAVFHLDEIAAFRNENHTFEDIVAYGGWDTIYSRQGFSEPLHGCVLTPNASAFWGVPPLLGRGFTEQDAQPDASPVVLLSFSFWKSTFNADPSALGRTMLLNSQPHTIVGVMPPRFVLFGADFYAPISWHRPDPTIQQMFDGEPGYFFATGIVKPRVHPQTAAADLQPIAERLVPLHKEDHLEKVRIVTSSMSDLIVGDFKRTLLLLIASVVLLLFISSSNVASLLLVHNSSRAKEIALRKALGAGRTRLMRQLLLESFVLGAAGCLAGSFLAYIGLRAAKVLDAGLQIPGEADISLNIPVLLFAIAISLLTSLLFGLSPAIFAAGKDVRGNLQSAGVNDTSSRRGSRLRSGLVVGQVALSLLLLVFAGLMIRSFLSVTRLDLGFSTKNILASEVHFPAQRYDTVESKRAYFEAVLARLSAVPGVLHAATAIGLPLEGGPGSRDVTIPGKPHSDTWTTSFEACSEDFFATLGLPLLRGRLLSSADVVGARRVAVVNHTLAEKYFPGENPIGQQIKFNEFDQIPMTPHDAYFEIVGVVSDYRNYGVERPILPQAFIPYTFAGLGDRSLLVRTSGDPTAMLNTIRKVLAEVDPNPVLAHPGALDDYLADHDYLKPRFRLISFSICAALGLGLSMIGLFGVMAYSVALQTHALGVRMALGAQQGNILTLVLRQGLLLVGSGVALGLVAALLAARALQSQLWGISMFDPGAFVLAPLALLLTGLLACYLPARRATRVDPIIALRYE
jgi:putative ABC transport system permease protein